MKLPHELPCEPVSNKVILRLSRILRSWKFIGRALDLDESDIERIESDYLIEYREQCYQMLRFWRLRDPENANYQVLGEVLQGEDSHIYLRYVEMVFSRLAL